MSYQEAAVVRLAPAGDTLVDYSDDISGFGINLRREDRPVPATYGHPDESSVAGARTWQVTIKYNADYASDSLWAMLLDAAFNGDGDVDFEVTYNEGAVSASNPMYTGTFTVTDIDIGSDVNTYFMQEKTYRAKDVASDTTP